MLILQVFSLVWHRGHEIKTLGRKCIMAYFLALDLGIVIKIHNIVTFYCFLAHKKVKTIVVKKYNLNIINLDNV